MTVAGQRKTKLTTAFYGIISKKEKTFLCLEQPGLRKAIKLLKDCSDEKVNKTKLINQPEAKSSSLTLSHLSQPYSLLR